MKTLTSPVVTYLKLISGEETITIPPTDGTKTIAGAYDIFNHIDSNFINWSTNVKSESTKEMSIAVHEMIKDGDFSNVFGSLSDDLDRLCLTQPQIIQFVRNHRKWLRTDGYATFFLFKVNNKRFVARVFSYSGGNLYVYVCHFSYGSVWTARYRHRVVFPRN